MTYRTPWTENITAAGFGLFVLLMCVYFSYAVTKGPHGLYEKGKIEAAEATKTQQLDLLVQDRLRAENMARRMSDSSLDLDLLDEQARSILGMMRNDEIIIR